MSLLKEFKAFALKGNVIDLAVAVIIGAAFGAIVTSLVADVVTPLLLTPALKAANVVEIDKLSWGGVKYGKFLSAVINFIFIAIVMFALIKAANSLSKKEQPPAPAEPSSTDKLLMEIRDALKK